MSKKQTKIDLKRGGTISKVALYTKISRLAPKAIDKLDRLMDSKNDNIVLGAANKVLDKTLPDQKPEIVINQQFNAGEMKIEFE